MDGPITIARVAKLLEENPKTALILGSRAGALSRSYNLADKLAFYGKSVHFLTDRERFSDCYSLLKLASKREVRNDLVSLLNEQIENVGFSIIEDYLATLVEKGIFKMIISFNPDNMLSDAFAALELEKKGVVIEFDPDRYTVDDIRQPPKRDACKVLKLFNEIDAFVDSLDKPQVQEKNSRFVKNVLERLWIKQVIVVGIDLSWDEIILSALPPKLEAIWFIHEDEKVKEKFHAQYEGVQHFGFITGLQGEYANFLQALYWQINPGIPPLRYGLTSQLQNQLNVMQTDLKSIKEDLKMLQTDFSRVERQVMNSLREIRNAMMNNPDDERE
jgi:hypothetical protein